MDFYSTVSNWLNTNQGVLALLLFCITIFLGWLSGIFRALRKKPKFKISLILGPTFTTTIQTGTLEDGTPKHKTAIVLYLNIANVGNAPSQIKDVKVAYHWNLHPWKLQWLKYGLGWFWLDYQTVSIEDFHCKIGENIKVFPFLFQGNSLTGRKTDTYLREGQVTNGIVYFEQRESWGGCHPKNKNDRTMIKIAAVDANDKTHTLTTYIDVVTLAYAKTFNPSFGETLSTLNGKPTEEDN